MNLERNIRTLVNFLASNGIDDYVVTGSAALIFHGLTTCDSPAPHDIDIIVRPKNEEQRCKWAEIFSMQEQLSDCVHKDYENSNFYAFKLGEDNTVVNVFCAPRNDTDLKWQVMLFDDGLVIKVHSLMQAIKAKLELKRQKDFVFFADLVRYMSDILLK